MNTMAKSMGRIALALILASSVSSRSLAYPAALAQAPTPAPVDFSGIWMRTKEDPNRPGVNWASRPVYVQNTPYTPEAKIKHDTRDPKDEPGPKCIQASMPRMMLAPYPTQIYQQSNQILVVNEANNTIRRIWLDRDKHLDDLVPTFHGDSIGHWEGKTLVIDTAGFNGKNDLDQGGTLMSANLHVVERWTIIEGPKPYLEVKFHFEDPTMYTRPFDSTVNYSPAPDLHLREYICGDNPRDLLLTEPAHKPLYPVQTFAAPGPAVRQGNESPPP
jgi:hypothetical protein